MSKTSKQTTNQDAHIEALKEIADLSSQIHLGGGQKRIQKHKEKGKLTARERIDYLLDDPNEAIEIGEFAAHQMYEEHGGCPSAGVVVKIGKVSSKMVIVVANDATVKAGAWFPMTAKKNLRAQEIAMENKIPIIYLVDSAGVYLPMQDEIFPDKEHFGRIFRNNAKMSSQGILQISAIMGSCVAGGAYLPIMSDEALIVENTGSIFLAGSYLVKAAIGENIDNETLGGAHTHSAISGVTDYKVKDDFEALDTIKSILDKCNVKSTGVFNRSQAKKPELKPDSVLDYFPSDRSKPYDMRNIIKTIVDQGSITEYKKEYGKTLLTLYAKIDGWSVGIVANQREIVKNAKGEMQIGGVIYSDSADKAARFIANCNQKKIPLVFFQDVTGFMVGSKSEHEGIIKDGAKMVNAVSNSVVPKFTFILGNSYGAGNYAMCGKAYDPRFIFSWPSAQLAVMSGNSAAKVLLQIESSRLTKGGQELSEEKSKALFDKIKAAYDNQISPVYAASRLWTDGIIDPRKTREIISRGIEIADFNSELDTYNPGVLQV
ncbi:MAG: acyl-CoA carboxylase subunit beta [Flavobacteriaceae bacterium]